MTENVYLEEVQCFQLSVSIFVMLDMCCYLVLQNGNQE